MSAVNGALYFDGGARPKNPGYSACAFVLTIPGREQIKFSRYLKIGTNNAAEYTGLIVGLKRAKEEGVTHITIFTDSQLIEGHLQKNWTVGGSLFSKMRTAHTLLAEFESWEIHWTPRLKNEVADGLCTAAINWGRNKNPWTQKLKGTLEPAYVLDPYM